MESFVARKATPAAGERARNTTDEQVPLNADGTRGEIDLLFNSEDLMIDYNWMMTLDFENM